MQTVSQVCPICQKSAWIKFWRDEDDEIECRATNSGAWVLHQGNHRVGPLTLQEINDLYAISHGNAPK